MSDQYSDFTSTGLTGLLIIGDPHLEGRSPGFRKDDYPNRILKKLSWCLEYARANRLLPAILGDLFDKPRDNPTWMLGQLIDMLAGQQCIGIYGNHDCADPELSEHDSLSLLIRSGRIQMVDSTPWQGWMNGRRVIVGGSSYRQKIPASFTPEPLAPTAADPRVDQQPPLVIWLTHHDLIIPGYEEQGRVRTAALAGVDLVINGHIHRPLQDVQQGKTLWTNPGNISRRSRNDAVRQHVPSAVRLDISLQGFTRQNITIPHEPFDEVFHPMVVDAVQKTESSAFVAGLAELQARRTQGGAGLMQFLELNLDSFEPAVTQEIMALAKEVTTNA